MDQSKGPGECIVDITQHGHSLGSSIYLHNKCKSFEQRLARNDLFVKILATNEMTRRAFNFITIIFTKVFVCLILSAIYIFTMGFSLGNEILDPSLSPY